MSEESLNQKIKDWLAVNGYPLEMRVAGACREASFGVVQSEYVLDKSSDKYREIDVLAYRQVGSPSGEIHAALIIECKSDKSKPWILFKNKIGYDARTVIQRTPASIAGKTSLMRSSLDEHLQDCFLFKVEERSGYSLVRAFENKDSDSAYQAISSVSTCARAYVQYFDDLKLSKFHAYSFPVLVVEAPLFEVYEFEGSLQINEIESGMMIWRNPLAERHSIVRIVAAKSFEKTIVTMALSLEIFLREIESALEKKIKRNKLVSEVRQPEKLKSKDAGLPAIRLLKSDSRLRGNDEQDLTPPRSTPPRVRRS